MSGGGGTSSAGGSRASQHHQTPKDAQVMAALLKDMGVSEYEPKVIDQMLDFAYKYVTSVLEEAKVCSGHAKKRSIDSDDVRLAIHLLCDKSFTNPPPREMLMEVARVKNAQQLPLIKSTSAARLPPDRYTLTSTNYRCKIRPRPPIQKVIAGGPQSVLSKATPAVPLTSKTGATLSVLNKISSSAPSQVTIVSRPPTSSMLASTVVPQRASTSSSGAPSSSSTMSSHSRPLIKLSSTSSSIGAPVSVLNKPKPASVVQTGGSSSTSGLVLPSINIVSSSGSGTSANERKRKVNDS